MRDRCFGMLFFLAVLCAPQLGYAEQIAGMLVRVGLDSVTLHGSNNERLVMQVERVQRSEAAPFLGKWVTVDFRTDKGSCRAVRFRPVR